MQLKDEIAFAIKNGFASQRHHVTMHFCPDEGPVLITVEGFAGGEIKVYNDDVDVPIPPFTSGHASGIGLDVQAILATRNHGST